MLGIGKTALGFWLWAFGVGPKLYLSAKDYADFIPHFCRIIVIGHQLVSAD
jgi:hypothetical protein